MNKKVTPLDLQIADKIKKLRDFGHGGVPLSKAKMARVLGIQYQSYSDMERGRVSFRVSTLAKLCEFYGVNINHFMS